MGVDPDEAFSRVPYEKGSLFLYFLECEIVKSPKLMSEWLHQYLADFAYKTVETSDFRDHFIAFFSAEKHKAAGIDVAQIDWAHWLHGEGLPGWEPRVLDDAYLTGCRNLAEAWLARPAAAPAADVGGWKAAQLMVFLDTLIESVEEGASGALDLGQMEAAYGFNATRNVEVSCRWLLLNIKLRNEACFPVLDAFLGTHGRGSYVKPLFLGLRKWQPEKAKELFGKHKDFYQDTIKNVLARAIKA